MAQKRGKPQQDPPHLQNKLKRFRPEVSSGQREAETQADQPSTTSTDLQTKAKQVIEALLSPSTADGACERSRSSGALGSSVDDLPVLSSGSAHTSGGALYDYLSVSDMREIYDSADLGVSKDALPEWVREVVGAECSEVRSGVHCEVQGGVHTSVHSEVRGGVHIELPGSVHCEVQGGVHTSVHSEVRGGVHSVHSEVAQGSTRHECPICSLTYPAAWSVDEISGHENQCVSALDTDDDIMMV